MKQSLTTKIKAATQPPPSQRVDSDARANELRRQLQDIRRQYGHAVKELADARKALDISLGVSHELNSRAPAAELTIERKGQSNSESTAVLVASDWHVEETVDPATVSGLNEYNLDISRKRATAFFRNGLKLVEMCRSRSRIDTLVLALLGDLISGYIHDELIESNELSPTEALQEAYDLICSGLDFLLAHGGFQRILVPCCYGNHGRTTDKKRIKTGAANNFEWLLYQFLQKRYAGEKRVSFKIAAGYHEYVQIYGFTYRFHHGDNIRYQGGVGDVDIPLNKAIAQWNKAKRADVDVLGHWHSRKMSRNFVLNGSLMGYNPFSIAIKAAFEPPCQSFFLVHPERGKTVEAPVYLDTARWM